MRRLLLERCLGIAGLYFITISMTVAQTAQAPAQTPYFGASNQTAPQNNKQQPKIIQYQTNAPVSAEDFKGLMTNMGAQQKAQLQQDLNSAISKQPPVPPKATIDTTNDNSSTSSTTTTTTTTTPTPTTDNQPTSSTTAPFGTTVKPTPNTVNKAPNQNNPYTGFGTGNNPNTGSTPNNSSGWNVKY